MKRLAGALGTVAAMSAWLAPSALADGLSLGTTAQSPAAPLVDSTPATATGAVSAPVSQVAAPVADTAVQALQPVVEAAQPVANVARPVAGAASETARRIESSVGHATVATPAAQTTPPVQPASEVSNVTQTRVNYPVAAPSHSVAPRSTASAAPRHSAHAPAARPAPP